MAAVEIIGKLSLAIGKPFEKNARILLGSMFTLLGDQKIHIRTATVASLENVFSSVGLESFIPSISQSLLIDQPQMRKELLKFLIEKLDMVSKSETSVPDLSPMIQATLVCLQDKNSDVRKFASSILIYVAKQVGIDLIHEKAGDLFKGAALSSLSPYLDSARATLRDSTAQNKAPSSTIPVRTSTSDGSASSLSLKTSKVGSTTSISKPKLRPSGAAGIGSLSLKKEETSISSEISAFPLITNDPRLKEIRASQDRGMNKWTFETPRRELIEFLREQCEGNLTAGIINLLFSTDHYKEKDFLSGLNILDEAALSTKMASDAEIRAKFVVNSDLILKYLTIRFFDTNTSMLIKSLDLLEHLFDLIDIDGSSLTEYEASSFLPFFINKVKLKILTSRF